MLRIVPSVTLSTGFVLLILQLSVMAESISSDWTHFRGPEGNGVSRAQDVPAQWSDNENIVWKFTLPGAGASTPVTHQGRVYLTSYTGYYVPGEEGGSLDRLERHLICLDLNDGREIWKRSIPAKLPEEEQIRDHGFAANSPAVDDTGVYVFFGKSGVFAFSHTGEQLWQADVGRRTSGWGTAASPVIYENLLLINASVESESLIALNRSSGKEVWRLGGINESWNTPLVVKTEAGQDELVLARHGKVLGVQPQSGELLWDCDTDITWYMVPSVVSADGIVFVLGGRSGSAALAVRCGGRGDVTKTHRLWTSMKGSNVTSPVYHDGHLYWMHESIGIAYCCHAETGELVYEERISRAGQVYASAVLVDGKIFYLNRSGTTFVVAAKPQFDLIHTNSLNERSQFDASPAVAGDSLLVRSGKTLYRICAK